MTQKTQEIIGEVLSEQKNNLFLWAPFCFTVGIAVYFGLKVEPSFWVGGRLTLTFFVTVLGLIRRQDDNALKKLGFLLSIGGLLMAAGFSIAQIRTNLVHTPMLVKKMSPVGLTGTIESIEPLSEKDGSRVILKHLNIERLKQGETPRKIRLKIRKDDGLKTGQHIRVLAGLNPAGSPVAPNAFDFQRMAYFDGIGAVGFSYNQPEILEQDHNQRRNKASWLSTIRSNIAERITTRTESPQQAIIIALMTGQRGAIDNQDWDALRQSGLAHLLAISGLHVGMVAGVLFFFSRLFMAFFPALALHHPIKKYAAIIALIGALFYTLVVGATIPTQRALMMTGLVMIAIIFDRSPFSLRLVALAAMVVLFFSPESLTSVSFQMSFAAVVSLIYFYNLIRPYWSAARRQAGFLRKFLLYFAGISLTTIIAGTATGLFSLYHFQNYAAYGLLSNIVAVPLMGAAIMPLIVLSYVLMPLGLEAFPLSFVEWGVGWVLATAHWTANLEGAVWHIPAWPQWIFILMVCCAWFWIVWKGRLKLIILPVFIILVGLTSIYKQANILISSKVDLIAIDNKSGSLWLSTGRKDRYTADQWMRLNGQAGQKKLTWPKEGTVDGFPLTCGQYGCRGDIEGHKISIAFNNKAWKEDCNWADIVISKEPVPYKACKAKTVIDFFDVWREGNHAIWLAPNKVKVKTVEEQRGLRPWTQTAANRKFSKKN